MEERPAAGAPGPASGSSGRPATTPGAAPAPDTPRAPRVAFAPDSPAQSEGAASHAAAALSAGSPTEGPPTRFVILLLLLGCLIAYRNSLDGEFVFDDELLIQKNPVVQNPHLWPQVFGFGTGHMVYRPLRTFSYVIDSAIGGRRPWIFHMSNVVHHWAVCAMVYVLATSLLGEGRAAFLAALVFALHPLHTEAVAYVSGRRDLLSTLLVLGALQCFLTARRRARSGECGVHGRLVLVAVLWFLALLSKEMAVTLPALCLLLDLWEGGARPTLGRIAGYLVFFGAAGLYALHATDPSTGVTLAPRPHAASHGAMLATMARIFAHQLRLWVWPSTLLADYSKDAFPVSASLVDPAGLLCLTLHAAFLAWGFVQFRRGTVPGLCVLCFYVSLAPISQIVQHSELASEHSLYFPSVFLAIPTGMAMAWMRERRPPLDALLIAIVAGLTVRTVVRNHDWSDSLALYQATVRDAPRCARAQTNLALAWTALGETARAASAYEHSLAVEPDDPYTLNNFGSLQMETGHPDKARVLFRRALTIHPAYAEAWNNLGALCRQQKELAGSRDALEHALAIDPKYVHAYVNLGLTLKAAGMLDKALDAYQKALALDATSIEAVNNLAVVLIEQGRSREALLALDAAVSALGEDPVLRLNHARALLGSGQAAAAAVELRALLGQPVDQSVVRDELERATAAMRGIPSTTHSTLRPPAPSLLPAPSPAPSLVPPAAPSPLPSPSLGPPR